VSSAAAAFLFLLIMVTALVRLIAVRRRSTAKGNENVLDTVMELAVGALVAYWGHRVLRALGADLYPATEVGAVFLTFVVGFLAALDLSRNGLATGSQRTTARFVVVGLIASSFLLARFPQPKPSPAFDERVTLELAASNGPVKGKPGEVPPFLEVLRDSGGVIEIRNRMDRPLRIRLRRYSDGYHCPVYFDIRLSPDAALVQAGATQKFQSLGCRVGPLEFEVTLTSSPLMLWQTATPPERQPSVERG
jgi:hypothetical protein